MSPERRTLPFDDFLKAFECIVESAEEECGKRSAKNALDSHKEHAKIVYKLLADRGLRLSRIGETGLSDMVKSLLLEWEESAPSTIAVQQLASLLSKSSTKTLFWAYDIVSSGRFSPKLPDVPYEVDDEEGLSIKLVRLVKGSEPLGATIKCDAHGAVYIARVIAGGVADRSACIQVGDRVMEVNGVAVTGMNPSDIVKLLNNESGTVVFKLVPAEIPASPLFGSQFVRAMMDYSGSSDSLHPCPEAALCFARGDILELVMTADEHWWQAHSLGHGAFASSSNASIGTMKRRVGLIPSESLQQKRRPSKEKDKYKGVVRRVSKVEYFYELQPSTCLYEPVTLMYPNRSIIRTIVLIGPPGVGRNELKKRLIAKYGDRYASSVPHTSRPRRMHEKEGIDYHFVKRADMEQWIREGCFLEFGEYKDNLYGTLVDSVVAVIEKGRTPILTPHPLALRTLRSPLFKPFIIFVKPPEFEILKESRRTYRSCSTQTNESKGVLSRSFMDSELEQMIAGADQLYQIYGHLFDMTLVNANLEAAFEQLCNAVEKLEKEPTWVPTAWINSV